MVYLFGIFSLLFSISSAWSSPADEPVERRIPILDTAQELLGDKVNLVANRLDLFFANQRADDELGRSLIRLRTDYSIRERALPRRDTQFRFNLKLPSLEERFKLSYFEKKKDETPQERADREAKIIKKSKLDTDWIFRTDAGLNVSLRPGIFTRARLRKSVYTGTLIHRFVQEIAWYSTRGFIEQTTLFTDQSINENLLFRFNNTVDWEIIQKKFNTFHGPSLIQKLSDNDAISWNLGLSTVRTNGVFYVTNYTAALNYRRNIYKNWFFFNFVPGIDFPKEWSFRRTPFAVVQLELLFGS